MEDNNTKPHIVKMYTGYAIRKWTAIGWQFLDTEDEYWWHGECYLDRHCIFTNRKLAEKRLDGWVDYPGEEA
jgi:hypothetical protein